MGREMGFGRVNAYLVAGILNSHIFMCEGDEDLAGKCEDACCPECCAPCKALVWLRDYQNGWLRIQLNLWDDNPDGRWSWQLPDGSVNWEMVERHWRFDMGCHEE